MALIPLVSHIIAALAFGLASLLLFMNCRRDLRGGLLVAATALTAMWALTVSWLGYTSGPVILIELSELLRAGGWLAFLSVLLYPVSQRSRWLWGLTTTTIGLVVVSLVAVISIRLVTGTLFAEYIHSSDPRFAAVALGLAVLGLVLLEQLLRNVSSERRTPMQFLGVGVGLLFAYDIYLHSYTLLYQQPNVIAWDARGLVTSLAAPLILIAARRNRDWNVPVFVSRDVVFQTATVIAVGSYLLLVALGGYYVRDFGGSWGEFAQIVLVVGGLLGLVTLLTSQHLRRKLRVLINKHFFLRKYDYREEWLRLTDRLAEERDALTPYERAVEVMADVVESPAGLVWREGDEGFELCAAAGTNPPDEATIPTDAALVDFLRQSKWIVDLAEWRDEPARYRHMVLPPAMERVPNAWAVVPLLYQETLTGFVLLTRPPSGGVIEWEDRDLLKTLGKQIASYLGQHENARALAQARQFEAFNQLTAFLMHDLKNLIAQQSLIVENADKHKHNPEFVDDAFATIADSVKRMERILEYMQRRKTSQVHEHVDVQQLLEEVVQRCVDREPQPSTQLEAQGVQIETDREEFAMVVTHLLRNAQDATPAGGSVGLSARCEDGAVVIEIRDSGCGMSQAFIREELFKPFHTTKSTQGMGIGAHQAREFARRHEGHVAVASQEGEGTSFRLVLPLTG